jgi:hypothetical protein
MGTSALEMAARALPVALIDYSLAPLPRDAGYDWLFDTRDFTLGNDAAWGEARARSLADLVGALDVDGAARLGQACYDYARTRHGLAAVAGALGARVQAQAPLPEARLRRLERLLNPALHSAGYRAARALRRRLRGAPA